jgi:GTPase involved in cell partitioning and DNA repair
MNVSKQCCSSFRTCCVKLHTSNSAHPHQRTNLASGTTPALLRLLKAYKPIATVGVVTFLIISKSSLINTLKRAKVRRRVSLG